MKVSFFPYVGRSGAYLSVANKWRHIECMFTIIVKSAIWYEISFVANKYYWKSTGFNDQKYLIQYASKIKD
jgi:hypothetical protein